MYYRIAFDASVEIKLKLKLNNFQLNSVKYLEIKDDNDGTMYMYHELKSVFKKSSITVGHKALQITIP